ncbi:MAG: amino acid ABC transporter permease [Clostridiales bacterium]|jgi:His/Glu/Gln/Arg/opine family amino acid ABC transporter permease subunit|nr:amino acid ABC transporter permease [Clostridiales bacterium]
MDVGFILEMLPALLPAVKNTLLITFASAALGWAAGFAIALARAHRVRGLSQALSVYVSFLRSVPLVIIMFFIYYAIPTFIAFYRYEHGLDVAVAAGNRNVIYPIIAMSLSESAFASEVFRSSLSAVSHDQMEAARSVGMTAVQAYRRIVLPQAIVVAIPNLGGLFVGLVKSSTLAYYASVVEITGMAYTLASPSYQFLEAFFVIALLYEALSFGFSRLFLAIERNVGKYRRGIVLK